MYIYIWTADIRRVFPYSRNHFTYEFFFSRALRNTRPLTFVLCICIYSCGGCGGGDCGGAPDL